MLWELDQPVSVRLCYCHCILLSSCKCTKLSQCLKHVELNLIIDQLHNILSITMPDKSKERNFTIFSTIWVRLHPPPVCIFGMYTSWEKPVSCNCLTLWAIHSLTSCCLNFQDLSVALCGYAVIPISNCIVFFSHLCLPSYCSHDSTQKMIIVNAT
jgi:hypothetical protein